MNTKDILTRHFDRSPVKTETCTQYFQMEYWGPKDQDSLALFLEDLQHEQNVLERRKLKDSVQQSCSHIRNAIEEIEEALNDEL